MGAASSTVECTLANRYHQKIWVKYDVERKYVSVKEYTIKGQVGAGGFTAGIGVSAKTQFDWVKVKADFTPVPPRELIDPVVNCEDKKIMFLTIIADDKKILCNTYGIGQKHRNLVVTEKGMLRKVKPKNYWDDHPDYEELYKHRPKISQLSAEKESSRDIQHKDDNTICSVWATAVTANDTLLLADFSNKNIKSVSPEGISALPFPTRPRAITIVDTKAAAVAGTDRNLYLLDITNPTKLSVICKCPLKYLIYAMATLNNNLVVSCESCETDPWCIKMITLNNADVNTSRDESARLEPAEAWTTSTDISGQFLFASSAGISTTTFNGTTFIVVTDRLKSTLTLLEAETGMFVKTLNMSGQEPRGITADEYGNVYVCLYNTCQIHVWSNDFENSKVLMSGVEGPNRIVYSSVKNNLCISYDNKNTVDYIQLRMNDDQGKTVDNVAEPEASRPVKQSQKTAKRSIQLLTATQSEAFKNMRHKKDTRNCFILGLAVNKSGTLFLTDRNNKNIKSMSPDREVHQTAIPVSPVAFTFLDTTTAVAAGDDKKLYIFDIRDHTTLIRRHEHQLEYGILGMTNYNGNLVVTCATEPTCVKMIEPREPKWEELWVSKDKSGENLFEYPNGITTTSINGKGVIVVTDARKHSLTLLEAETGKFMKSQDVARKKPWGITVDNDGNVYVCYEQTSEICVWSNDLTKSKILLTVKDLILQPFYIVYNGENDSLYISYSSFHNKANTVDRFSLNKK